jgi:hypothetical protein
MSAPQGSAEWLRERAGHCTASRFKDVLAKVKVGEAAGRRNYRVQLVTERLIGAPISGGYKSAAMEWGTQTEPLARLAYEAHTGEPVVVTGFHLYPAIEWCGCSPDGLLADDGLIEIKCPEPQTHLEWLLDGACPSEHIPQIQGAMFVTNRKFCDFVSYDPRFPENRQLLIVRVQRDDAYIAELEKQVRLFLREVDQLHDRLLNGGALMSKVA